MKKPELFARHGRIRVQSKASAFWGLFFKAVGMLTGVAVAITGISIWEISNTIKNNGIEIAGATALTQADLDGPINMLLVGSDTREGQGGGYGNDTSVLADVIILLHISADRKNAVALSFPRDLLVPWPACPSTSTPPGPGYLAQSLGQINATIANGGPGCTLLTVEQLTGVDIPYLAMIDFKGVIEMSNAIGGVDVCVAEEISDPYTQTYLQPGEYTLSGKDALQFLRTRHGVGDGSDLSRISNQQSFLTSLVRKVKSQGVLSNPVYLYSLASAAARNMQLSESLTDVNVMVALASALKDVELDKITFLQVPSRGGLPKPYSGRVAPIYEQANVLFSKIANDEPLLVSGSNTGSGSVVASPAPSSSASASPSPSASSSASPSASAEVLPDWARGTNAAVTTCSG
ncbi:LCP family protein [Rhodoluna limnophila]|uniref:LCP family protein n=1 Tax=Rhodoluna limnophila TaxID=232537 RepID=UPI00110740CD|nr:LCP family protein [Rhodoluna limnophila]